MLDSKVFQAIAEGEADGIAKVILLIPLRVSVSQSPLSYFFPLPSSLTQLIILVFMQEV
ncbi:hypothetical protein [Merismopedia glauca]|uniref:hypothetical protein n=1 Tax=Merismopedia glauca TaxID=292586 RepID=UPI0015E6F58C|nr:hypothetical protein [Merismopedia glauca]